MDKKQSIQVVKDMELVPEATLGDIVGGKFSFLSFDGKKKCFINFCHVNGCTSYKDTARGYRPQIIFPIPKRRK